jgi:hypothetical protein
MRQALCSSEMMLHQLLPTYMQSVILDSHCGLQYWDDESDALRPKEGTLLPLSRFTFRKAKNKAVRLVESETL